MTPTPNIPANHIIRRPDGSPEALEVATVADLSPAMPVALMAFATTMTEEEVSAAKSELQRKIDAVATLTGHEVPEEITAALENFNAEEVHRALVGEPFEVCWN